MVRLTSCGIRGESACWNLLSGGQPPSFCKGEQVSISTKAVPSQSDGRPRPSSRSVVSSSENIHPIDAHLEKAHRVSKKRSARTMKSQVILANQVQNRVCSRWLPSVQRGCKSAVFLGDTLSRSQPRAVAVSCGQ